MSSHGRMVEDGLRNAGTPAGREALALVEAMFGRAVRAGLVDDVLLCARARTDIHHLDDVRRQIIRTADWAARFTRALGAEGNGFDREALNSRLVQLGGQSKHAKYEGRRARPITDDLKRAATRLIEFVQREYASAGLGTCLAELTAIELRGTQAHAFEALRRPSRGNATARAILGDVSVLRPLQACRTCYVVFEDNATRHGPMADLCETHRGGV